MAYDITATAGSSPFQHTLYNTTTGTQITGDVTLFASAMFDTNPAASGFRWLLTQSAEGETEAANVSFSLGVFNNAGTNRFTSFWEHSAGTNDQVDCTGMAVSTGTWYRVAMRRDVTANNVYFAVNGTLYGPYTSGYAADPTGATTAYYRLGCGAAANQTIDGRLQDVAVYNSALPDELMIAYSMGVSPLSIKPSALQHYWPLQRSGKDMIGSLNLSAGGSVALADGVLVTLPHGIGYERSMAPAAGGSVPSRFYYDMMMAA